MVDAAGGPLDAASATQPQHPPRRGCCCCPSPLRRKPPCPCRGIHAPTEDNHRGSGQGHISLRSHPRTKFYEYSASPPVQPPRTGGARAGRLYWSATPGPAVGWSAADDADGAVERRYAVIFDRCDGIRFGDWRTSSTFEGQASRCTTMRTTTMASLVYKLDMTLTKLFLPTMTLTHAANRLD